MEGLKPVSPVAIYSKSSHIVRDKNAPIVKAISSTDQLMPVYLQYGKEVNATNAPGQSSLLSNSSKPSLKPEDCEESKDNSDLNQKPVPTGRCTTKARKATVFQSSTTKNQST
jgi:hypothetical protein